MKLQTIDLKGKAYATVPTRIKEFREQCPNGDIKTTPQIQPDGQIIFTAYILKDKSNPDSASATGHSIGTLKGDKAFEKLETIAIGRALAILGFMASGDVASSEEMEAFNESKKAIKLQGLMEMVDEINDIEMLREFYKNNKGNGKEFDAYIIEKSNQLKNANNS